MYLLLIYYVNFIWHAFWYTTTFFSLSSIHLTVACKKTTLGDKAASVLPL